MAIGASTVWRVRTGGNDANGAGFNSTIASAGTDYSQQDSPQLSLSDLTSSASTTITSATGGFTSAMIGNALRISSGTGATVGYYFITGCTDTNTITVDRVSGTYTDGVGRVGGAAANLTAAIFQAGNSTGNKAAEGNIIYIRGAGSNSPSSADYTMTTYVTPPNGGTTSGRVRILGENGRPYITVNGMLIYNNTYFSFENFVVKCTGTNGGGAVLNIGGGSRVRNCKFLMGNQNYPAIKTNVTTSLSTYIQDVEIDGESSSAASSGQGILCGSYQTTIDGCHIHDCRDIGVKSNNTAAGIRIFDSVIKSNRSDGVNCTGNQGYQGNLVIRNVIRDNLGHGINIATSAALIEAVIKNNLITGHNQASKNGINIAAGTAALNDALAQIIDYNAFYNNTANYSGISAGAHDVVLSADPYVSSSDYTLNNTAGGGAACVDAGFPQTIPGL